MRFVKANALSQNLDISHAVEAQTGKFWTKFCAFVKACFHNTSLSNRNL